jgi:hypothetical protein
MSSDAEMNDSSQSKSDVELELAVTSDVLTARTSHLLMIGGRTRRIPRRHSITGTKLYPMIVPIYMVKSADKRFIPLSSSSCVRK